MQSTLVARKGVVPAGGAESRLRLATLTVSKALLPMARQAGISNPLSTPMLAGIRDVAAAGARR